MFEMTDAEFEEMEQAERKAHDEKVKEIEQEEKLLGNKEIWDNKDDIQKAVESLNEFTHNYCLNCKETEETKDLVFRCKECLFRMNDGICLVKRFKSINLPNFKDFGAMGDL